MSGGEFKGFRTWENLLDYLRGGRRHIYYHAPMDHKPIRVRAQATDVDGDTVRVACWLGCAFDPFDADKGHLDRFKKWMPQ